MLRSDRVHDGGLPEREVHGPEDRNARLRRACMHTLRSEDMASESALSLRGAAWMQVARRCGMCGMAVASAAFVFLVSSFC